MRFSLFVRCANRLILLVATLSILSVSTKAIAQFVPQPQSQNQQVRPASGTTPVGPMNTYPGAANPGQSPQPAYGQPAPNRGPVYGPQPAAGPVVPAQANIGPATPAANALAPQIPAWIPLPAAHEKYVDDVLNYWQQNSAKIKRYRCEFSRWVYDATFVNAVPGKPLPAQKQSKGVLMYESPDKGLFREETVYEYVAPVAPQMEPTYKTMPNLSGDHWICDGEAIFVFQFPAKRVAKEILPPEMRGKAIVASPLPFMFGADAATMKSRFWFRPLKSADSNEELFEAVPKTRDDAANYRRAEIVIDRQDFLPKALALYHSDKSYESFSFGKRETNWTPSINPFAARPFAPKIPDGWKMVVNDHSEKQAQNPAAPKR